MIKKYKVQKYFQKTNFKQKILLKNTNILRSLIAKNLNTLAEETKKMIVFLEKIFKSLKEVPFSKG